ncbi:MAG TPA: rRNA methyltransferase, partial [Microbacteriaceae bacterium]|nr:rRNA methyltransferase [Microbacteriaceae bacterium]
MPVPEILRADAAADDPRLADYANLTDVALRRKLEPAGGLYLAEGVKVLRRALAA